MKKLICLFITLSVLGSRGDVTVTVDPTTHVITQPSGSPDFKAANNIAPANGPFPLSDITGLGSGVPAAAGNPINGVSGLVATDANNLLGRLGLNASGVANAGIAADVWISIRGDSAGGTGPVGSGTKDDPYDGSTEARFDHFMGAGTGTLIHTPCHFHLGPGIYTTTGYSFEVGSRISGSGMDITTIQLKANSALTNGQKTELCTVNGTNTTGIDPTTIEDLTVDGNFPNQPQSPNPVCLDGGIRASQVLRCKVIQMGTTPEGAAAPYNLESFWVGAISFATTINVPAYNVVIRDSVCVSNNSNSYDTFFTVSGQNTSSDSSSTIACRNALVDNCKVFCSTPTGTASGHAFTFANVDGGILENCYTDGISAGYYQDTWASHNITIRNNSFRRASYGVFLNGSNSIYNDIVVEHNLFDLNPAAGIATYGVYFYLNSINRFSIQYNHIVQTPYLTPLGGTWTNGINDGGNPIGIKVVTEGTCLNGIVSNNCIDTPYGGGLENRLLLLNISSPNSSDSPNIQCENNYDSYGEWIFGKHHSRRTFIQNTGVGNRMWGYNASSLGGGVGDASASFHVQLHALLGTGTVTLTNGSATVALPAITSISKVVLHLVTASGTVGTAVSTANTAGTGFTVTGSTGDNSTYRYYATSGNNPNIVDFKADIPSVQGGACVLTQTLCSNPANNPTEPYFTTINAYWNGTTAAGGCEVNSNPSENALVTIDIYDQPDFQSWYCGNGSNGPQGAYTTLTLDYTKGIVSTGGIAGNNYTTVSGKSLTVDNTLTLAGTDGSTLNIGGGGTLGSAAYTAAGAYDAANSASTAQSNAISSAATSAASLYVPKTATIGVANGGTGLTTVPTGDLLLGNGTGNFTLLAPGANVATDLANPLNGSNGLLSDVGGTTTVNNNLTVPGTLTLSGGISGTIYVHSSTTSGFPTLGTTGKYEIGYDYQLGIPYIGAGAGNVNLVNTAGIGVPPALVYSGSGTVTGTSYTISGQPLMVTGSGGVANFYLGGGLTVAPGTVIDSSTGAIDSARGGSGTFAGASVDTSGGSDGALAGSVTLIGGSAKAASGNTAISGSAIVDAGPVTGPGTNTAGTVSIGTTNAASITIGRPGIQTILNGYGRGTAVMGIMTANTTGTITFNSTSQSETIYNTSSSTIASATITLPTSAFAGEIVRYATAGPITAITMAGGTVDIGAAPTSLAANGSVCWQADTYNHWIRLY